MLIGKSVDGSLRSGALKRSREIGCELEGYQRKPAGVLVRC